MIKHKREKVHELTSCHIWNTASAFPSTLHNNPCCLFAVISWDTPFQRKWSTSGWNPSQLVHSISFHCLFTPQPCSDLPHSTDLPSHLPLTAFSSQHLGQGKRWPPALRPLYTTVSPSPLSPIPGQVRGCTVILQVTLAGESGIYTGSPAMFHLAARTPPRCRFCYFSMQ